MKVHGRLEQPKTPAHVSHGLKELGSNLGVILQFRIDPLRSPIQEWERIIQCDPRALFTLAFTLGTFHDSSLAVEWGGAGRLPSPVSYSGTI